MTACSNALRTLLESICELDSKYYKGPMNQMDLKEQTVILYLKILFLQSYNISFLCFPYLPF